MPKNDIAAQGYDLSLNRSKALVKLGDVRNDFRHTDLEGAL